MDGGWRLEGVAVFLHEKGPANLAYAVECDDAWRSLAGRVWGAIGNRSIEYRIARAGTAWTLNDRPAPGLDHLSDLDLSFTPATNLLQLRRVAIGSGETVALPAAWLDIDAGALSELSQIYRRLDEMRFAYQAPDVGYEGVLELASNGFIRRYPDLWEAESPP
jgi:hypothetical protein